VNTDASVVFDEPQFAEPVHEEAYSGPGSSDHLRQRLLRNLWDQSLRFSGSAELRHEQQDSGQALFAAIEKLIDEVSLRAHAAGQQEL
jgi:hypothetical protein